MLVALIGVLLTVATDPAPAPPSPTSAVQIKNRRLEKNQTVAKALYDAGLDDATVNALHGALTAAEFNFKKARPGDQLRLVFVNGQLDVLDYRRSLLTEWQVRRDGERYVGKKREIEREQRVDTVELTVDTNVWDAAIAAGERPDVAITLSDVFAWDVDFYRDVQQGDVLRVVVERVLADGQPLRYGDVLAAEYVGETTGTRRLFRYVDAEGKPGYYDDAGQSAQRGFLKSPLKYAHLTSRFGSRKHPVLGYTRMHEGVDYGAPVGTPVWAVGDGRVEQAGWNGGCGKAVTIRHRNGFETVYCHLSSVAVSAGKGVAQKQIIGYTGQTGLATGPHLHYMVKKGGHAVNPLTLQLPREAPIPAAQLEDYKAKIAPLQARLRGDSVALN